MPLIRLLCLLLVAACATWFAVATHAQQDAPLFPAPSADSAPIQAAAPAQASAPGGLFHEVGRFVVQAERDFSRELNSHMAAIRRGDRARCRRRVQTSNRMPCASGSALP